MDNELKVSVIIPTRNGGHYLTSLLSSLKEQSTKPIQILVIDSSSEDSTVEICKSFGVDIIQIDAKAFDPWGDEKSGCLQVNRRHPGLFDTGRLV